MHFNAQKHSTSGCAAASWITLRPWFRNLHVSGFKQTLPTTHGRDVSAHAVVLLTCRLEKYSCTQPAWSTAGAESSEPRAPELWSSVGPTRRDSVSPRPSMHHCRSGSATAAIWNHNHLQFILSEFSGKAVASFVPQLSFALSQGVNVSASLSPRCENVTENNKRVEPLHFPSDYSDLKNPHLFFPAVLTCCLSRLTDRTTNNDQNKLL